jgi:serine phosphatase RsbU (regulator of sigma subunit)
MKHIIIKSFRRIINKTILINVAIIIPVVVVILVIMMLHLSSSINSLSLENIENTTFRTREKLKNFFEPVKKHLHIANKWSMLENYDSLSILAFNNRYMPILKFYPEVSGIIVADTKGAEYSLVKNDDTFINRIIKQSNGKKEIFRMKWNYDENLRGTLLEEWNDELYYDPRKRPWFIADSESNKDEICWSDTYIFFTSKNPGITASLTSKSYVNNKVDRILAFDILLTEISKFTKSLKVSKNGLAFVISNKGEVIGLPRNSRFDHPDSLKHYVLKPVDSIGIPAVSIAYNRWKESDAMNKTFRFVSDRQKWRAGFHSFPLGTNNTFIIGVIVPESDFMGQLRKTQFVILTGCILVLALILVVIRNNNQKKKANKLLIKKNIEIETQRDEIEAQRDKILIQKRNITSSIEYAKRIQTAVLPPVDYLDECMPEYFVLFKPRDIVSGDFYWISQKDDKIIVAAVDCTGHGVPGAFVSMLGVAFLNEIISKQEIIKPDMILNNLRKQVKKALRQSGKINEPSDGMDMALCVIDIKKMELQYAGAYTPLYLIRNKEITKLKADRMPVGIYIVEKDSFTNHLLKIQPRDVIYLFSDGYVDQFGGKMGGKFKYHRFRKLLLEIQDKSMDEQKNILDTTIEKWRGDLEQIDDILIVGFRM